jgi:hypothetical protein
MKCANEIVTKNEQAIAAREQAAITKALLEHGEACQNAIKFCEEVIAPAFEKKAENGEPNLMVRIRTYAYEDRFGNIHFDTMKLDYTSRTVHHRNGTKSTKTERTWVIDYENIDKATVIAYLAHYCYACSMPDSYGWLEVEPVPAC